MAHSDMEFRVRGGSGPGRNGRHPGETKSIGSAPPPLLPGAFGVGGPSLAGIREPFVNVMGPLLRLGASC